MRASRLMTREVRCVLPETSVTQAWALMRSLGVRHLPVWQDGRLVGLISDRDLLVRAVRVTEGQLFFAPDLVVGEVMTLNPVVCPQGAPVEEIAQLLVKHQIDSIPIVTPENKLVGLVTSTDLVALLIDKSRQVPWSFRIKGPDAAA